MGALQPIAQYSWEEAHRMITSAAPAVLHLHGFTIKTKSDRYKLFSTNRKCVVCGAVGHTMVLESHYIDCPPVDGHYRAAHFNLYGGKNLGKLFTKDHILPRSKGGADALENYQTMCAPCNQQKGDKIPGEKVVLVSWNLAFRAMQLGARATKSTWDSCQYLQLQGNQLLLLQNGKIVKSFSVPPSGFLRNRWRIDA